MGWTVHDHVVEMDFGSDLYIGNALTDMYAKFCCLDRARNVFDLIPKRDVESWNSMISGFCANEELEKALGFYFQMKVQGLVPDSFTVGSVFLACGNWMVQRDNVSWNIMISGYTQSGDLKEAIKLFQANER
ncbi:pentatricopeptide repeat-containing protein At3g03580-like [Aristolochia californica]|uniref:pentatricopeptide repeat-containing protein At3g03580-like n=1 Tax=Aristolochia californica TaxID=171875 RepID=UPI0035D6E85C